MELNGTEWNGLDIIEYNGWNGMKLNGIGWN